MRVYRRFLGHLPANLPLSNYLQSAEPPVQQGAGRVDPAHKAWVDQFDLTLAISDYSPEITVPCRRIYSAAKRRALTKTTTAPFDVFTWSNGKWQKDTFNVNLGDPIGGVDGAVDYSTGYSFADRRGIKNNTNIQITLVDRDGIADVREATKDADSPDYREKTQWVEQTKNGVLQQQPGFGPMGVPGAPPGYGGPPPGYGGPPPGYGGGNVVRPPG